MEETQYRRQIYKQQQSNMIIDGAEEPRYWEGVQVCAVRHGAWGGRTGGGGNVSLAGTCTPTCPQHTGPCVAC